VTVVAHTGIVLSRQLRPLVRDPFVLIFGVVQPLVFLALYGPLLPSMPGAEGTSPWQRFVPGIIVMVSLFGTSVAGSYLLEEIRVGSFERFLVTPLSRRSLLVGRALKEVVPLTLQALLIVAIVTPFGFQLHPAGIVLSRQLRPLARDPFVLIFGVLQPLVFLALYGPLLAALPGAGGASPWQWFVPGIIVMVSLFGTSVAGSYLLEEIRVGAFERFLVTPLDRRSLLVGRALKEVVPLTLQALLIIALVTPFGFRVEPAGIALGLLLLAVFGVGLGALSHSLAMSVRHQEYLFWLVQQTLLFPMLLLSGILLPMELAPDWLYALSRLNPLTYVVEAERALFAGDLADPSVAVGAAVAIGVAAVGLLVGTRLMRRAAA
jgi:ABC-2 type transport system permease protein